jgi:hypothetical protein
MDFNFDDYNENIEYCKYVYDKNEEYDLHLENETDIQLVANMYVDEIIEINDGTITDDLVENDLVLFQVVDEYLTKFKNRELDSDSIDYEPKSDAEIMYQSQQERIKSRRGGYDYTDAFNDMGLDEDDIDQIKML